MGGCLMWEPIVQPMTDLEFQCLVSRMLDRLDEQGWRLERKSVSQRVTSGVSEFQP
jgi:hypothetical protein